MVNTKNVFIILLKNMSEKLQAGYFLYMKFSILFFFILFSTINLDAQSIIWQTCLGGTGTDEAVSILHNDDGSIIVAGNTSSDNGSCSCSHGNQDAWIACLNSDGILRWRRCLGGSNMDNVHSVIRCYDGGYLLCGYTNSTDGDVQGFHTTPFNYVMDCWLVKLDSTGAIQWQHCYGGSSDDQGIAAVQLPDGGFVFTGYSSSIDGDVSFLYDTTGLGKDVWVVRVDAYGSILWDKTIGSLDNETPADLKFMPGNGIYVLSNSGQPGGDILANYGGSDIWLFSLDLTGALRWTKNYGGSGNDVGYKLLMSPGGKFWIGASSASSDIDVPMNYGGVDNLLLLLDSTGFVLSSFTSGGSQDDALLSLSKTDNSNSVVVLSTSSSSDEDVPSNYGSTDIWLYKFDSDQGILFSKTFGGSQEDRAVEVVVTQDGSSFFTGTIWSNDNDVTLLNGGSDIWVVSLSALIGVDEISSKENLVTVSPNPFSNQTTFYLPQKTDIGESNTLYVYDLSGKRIGGEMKFDGSSYELRNTEFSPGTYLYEILSSHGVHFHGYIVVGLK